MASNSKFWSQSRFYYAQLTTCCLEIFLSLYLLVQHTRLKVGIQDSRSFCSLGRFADCDVVNASSLSEFFGVPLAAIGALFYFLLLALGLMAQPKDRTFRSFQKSVLALALVGLGIDIGIFFVFQVLVLHSICLVCVATYVLGALHLYLVTKSQDNSRGKLLPSMKHLLIETPWPTLKDMPKTKPAFALLAVVLFGATLYMIPTFVAHDSSVYQHADDAIKQFFSEWKERPTRKIETRNHNGQFGNPNAKIHIVEFSDFECPFCRRAAFALHAALQPLKQKVFFTFKHFPLNSKCNPNLQYEMHAHACRLAMLAICAQNKDRFWEFHDEVFLRMNEDVFKSGFDPVRNQLLSLLSENEITSCLNSSTVTAQLSEDVKLGSTLNIQGTPALFINGKVVGIPITIENIQKLIQIEESLLSTK